MLGLRDVAIFRLFFLKCMGLLVCCEVFSSIALLAVRRSPSFALRFCRGGRDLQWVPVAQNLDRSAWLWKQRSDLLHVSGDVCLLSV